ncbi:MAG TPA: HTH domain-containing protein [Bacillota bacterium]
MSTKDRLLYILKKNDPLTIDEIMAHFTISEAAIRKHIHELEKQQFIQKQVVKQKIGRPFHKYMLTDKGHSTFPNQYKTLPVELLEDLEELYGERAVNDVLKKRMEREKASFQKQFQSDDFDRKILDIARVRDDHGYMVEVDQTDQGGYVFKHYNCPIANIATKYEQVCENERTVMEKIFPSSDVASHTSITKGDSVCTWTISRPVEDES